MIYISYGMTKSASTFLWLLTRETLRACGHDVIRLSASTKGGRNSPEDYVDPCDFAALRRVAAEVEDRSVVIKTHGPPGPGVFEAVEAGDVLANAILRDPREIALSLADHGTRSRETGIPDFAEFKSPEDAFGTLDTQFMILRAWTRSRRVLTVTYDDLCFDTPRVIERLGDQIGETVDLDLVLSRLGDRTGIRHFNKGVRERYREDMDPLMQQRFLERYAEIYRRYL
jgi:hypothetical protein